MTVPQPAPEPKPADPATVEIDPADQERFNTMFAAGLQKYLADNAPAPDKTKGRPKGITELLFGSGGS